MEVKIDKILRFNRISVKCREVFWKPYKYTYSGTFEEIEQISPSFDNTIVRKQWCRLLNAPCRYSKCPKVR